MSVEYGHEYGMKCHNTFLVAQGSKLTAKHIEKDDLKDETHAHWKIEKADEDGHVYLVSYNDHFVSIDSHHAIHMVAEKDKTCKFTLVQDESTGMYEFKSAHGHYITIDDDNHVKTSHDQPKKEQKFRLEKFNHGHKHHDKVHHAVNK